MCISHLYRPTDMLMCWCHAGDRPPTPRSVPRPFGRRALSFACGDVAAIDPCSMLAAGGSTAVAGGSSRSDEGGTQAAAGTHQQPLSRGTAAQHAPSTVAPSSTAVGNNTNTTSTAGEPSAAVPTTVAGPSGAAAALGSGYVAAGAQRQANSRYGAGMMGFVPYNHQAAALPQPFANMMQHTTSVAPPAHMMMMQPPQMP